jgi:hypothetical protein
MGTDGCGECVCGGLARLDRKTSRCSIGRNIAGEVVRIGAYTGWIRGGCLESVMEVFDVFSK